MPPPKRCDHAKVEEDSQRNLAAARLAKSRYNSKRTRSVMATEFFKRSKGKTVHPWQLDAAESFFLGLDTVIIAGTGAGKTTPFMLPLLLPQNKDRILVVVEPLINLQRDQVRRFKKMGISAKAVNSETWSDQTAKDIKDGKYQALFMGPEMCFRHAGGRALLIALGAAGKLIAIVVDESHCISQWGGEFRSAYSEMSVLRAQAVVPVPFVLASATMAPEVLYECEKSVLIQPERAFYVNLGNDHRNIKQEVRPLKNDHDYAALDDIFHFEGIDVPSDIPKTLVFANSRSHVQKIWRYIRSKLPVFLAGQVDFMHSLRTRRGKRRTMKRFANSDIQILVATESVGMGADLPDVVQVIQFGTPSSLTVWMQRAGRAGRDPTLNAVAYLLVEVSVFIIQNKRQPARNAARPRVRKDLEKEAVEPDDIHRWHWLI